MNFDLHCGALACEYVYLSFALLLPVSSDFVLMLIEYFTGWARDLLIKNPCGYIA